MSDNRNFPRYNVNCPILIYSENLHKETEGKVINVSEQGLCVDIKYNLDQFHKNDHIDFVFIDDAIISFIIANTGIIKHIEKSKYSHKIGLYIPASEQLTQYINFKVCSYFEKVPAVS